MIPSTLIYNSLYHCIDVISSVYKRIVWLEEQVTHLKSTAKKKVNTGTEFVVAEATDAEVYFTPTLYKFKLKVILKHPTRTPLISVTDTPQVVAETDAD